MKKIYFNLILIFTYCFVNAQTTLIGGATANGNFEAAAITPWVLANNPSTTSDNRWVVNTGIALAGTKSAYIACLSTNTYSYNVSQSVTQHIYQSVAFPAGQSCINLSFNWRCNGESSSSDWDNLKVFVSSTLPAGGTPNASADQVGLTWYNLQNTTQTANISLPASLAGTTKYLIFQFKCDASGGAQAPAAVDNVSLTTTAPPTPACATYSLPVNGASVCSAGQILSWSALAAPSCGSITYDVYFNAGTTATTLASAAQTGTTYATGALVNGTVYAWQIVPKNGSLSATGCSTFTFTANTPVPSCAAYISPANSATVCPIGNTLSWSAVTTTCGTISYDVYFNTGTSATTLVSPAQSGTTYALPNLAASTIYAWMVVPKNGTVSATGCSTRTFVVNSTTSPSVAPLSDNFESCLGWNIVNGSQTNIWVKGTATNNGGTQSMYVSNDGGTTNAYSTGSSSVVHFYKDIAFPAGQDCITLSFDWKSVGESSYDDLKLFSVATGVTPVAGSAMNTANQIGVTYQGQSTWQTVNITLPSSYAGTTQRLVFSWRNDISGGTQPPAAVDNISISTTVIPTPACATYSFPANGTTTVCPTSGQTLSWSTVTVSACSNVLYDVYFDNGLTATTLVSSAQSGTTYATGALTEGSTYAWKVVPRNGTLTATGCATFTFSANTPAPSCPTLITPANSSTICANAGLLSWNTVTTSCGSVTYDVYFNSGSAATVLVSSAQTSTVYNPGTLTANTIYAWKIIPRIGTVFGSACTTNTFATNAFISNTNAPFTDDFNGLCLDWTTVNGTETNKWVWGSVASGGNPAKGMYVSNDGGVSHNYNNGSGSVVHFYKDISFPATSSCSITLSFNWRNNGENNTDDRISVYGTNTSFVPVAGTQNNAADKLGSDLAQQNTWQTANISLPSSWAGTTKRIIFQWRNDGSTGSQAPGAIDNVSITVSSATVAPSCSTYSLPVNGATVCPSGVSLSWGTVTVSCGIPTYNVYFNTGTSATTLVSANQTGTTYALGALLPNTVYAWKILPSAGTFTASGCATFTFLTSNFVSQTTAPISDNFDGSCSEWTIINGSQANKWIQGPAVNNGGSQAMYITNDLGVTNAYDNTTTSIVHFYKDVIFPVGSSCISLSFDWKNVGESSFDYLRVFGVSTTVTPVAGTALVTGQVGTDYQGSSTWQTVNITLPSSYAGTTKRLVFSWRNDGSGGSNPPAAVDNVIISVSNPTVPSCASYIAPTNGANSGCISGTILQWGAVTALCTNAVTYDVYFNSGTVASSLVSGSQSGVTYNTGVLLANTVYAWKIVPRNIIGPAVGCITYTFTTGNGFVANNLPCNAINIPLGTIASGDNSCSDNSGEPTTPGCWDGGMVNSIWFSFVAPPSGNVKMRTATGTLVKTQLAVYSGACGSGMTYVNCNDNAPNCGGVTLDISELSLTGLVSGNTYYVAVDGNLNLVGTFALTVIESSSTYPALYGKSCSNPIAVCNSTMAVGDPGYQSIGFTCDDDGSANCTGGEKGSAWYQITAIAPGSLNFNIVPNDYVVGNNGAETDYDFVLWKVSGTTGTVSCTSIASSGGGSVSACNYSGDGVTGVAAGGNAPAPYPAYYNGAYEPTVTMAAGDVFVLLIENFSNSTSGFNLDFSASTPGSINYANPATVVWSGGAENTTWPTTSNWSGCSIPTCSINAVISPGSSFQPLITSAMGVVTVKSMTIDPGSVLTLGPNSVLKICESLTNNGTIAADPTSTILFSDDVTIHTLNGTLNNTSRLGNLTVTDAVGSTNCYVVANTNIELTGNFTTSNSTSVFDLNGMNLTIAGNFINSAGANTFSNTANSTITFNGNGAQTYNPNNNSATPSLTLNNVRFSYSMMSGM